MAQPSPGYSRRGYGRAGMLAFLDELSVMPAGEASTLYLPSRMTTIELEQLLGELPLEPDIRKEIGRRTITSPNGAALFSYPGGMSLVLPPFPIREKRASRTLDAGPLRAVLAADYIIAVVLVRLGAYAVGVCSSEKLLHSKVGTGNIHSRHRQGGSSAHRFERHRDKQIESFMNRACKHVREQLEPHLKALDYILYGGAKTTILLLQKYCPLLTKLEVPALPPLLDIPDPRQPVLEEAIKRAWTTEVMEWGLTANSQ